MNNEPVYRCRGCGGITQTEGLSCDCQVPSINDWEQGAAIFGIEDPAAAIQAARDALEMAEDRMPPMYAARCRTAINLLTPKPTIN